MVLLYFYVHTLFTCQKQRTKELQTQFKYTTDYQKQELHRENYSKQVQMHLAKHQFWEFYIHLILPFHHISETFGTWFSPSVGGRSWVRDIWTLHASILINVKILSAGDCQFIRRPNTLVFPS